MPAAPPGKRGDRIDGLPVGLKDVIAVEGQPLTCSSRMLADFVSPYDATVTAEAQGGGRNSFRPVEHG